MGLLDDAIREHLELKRRRGADPSEVAREESEALGPVRRADVEVAERPAPAPAEETYEDPYDDEPAGLEDPGAAYAAPVEETYEPEPEPEPEAAAPVEPPAPPAAGGQTREFSAAELEEALGAHEPPPAAEPEAAPAQPAAPGEEDVLEETPEFLQETPEHDRLWFEQKPPKDFDF